MEFRLNRIKKSGREWNRLVWRYDDPLDRNSRCRVFFRMDPELKQWLSDNHINHSISFYQIPSSGGNMAPITKYIFEIADPQQAMLFKLTWM